MTSLNDIHLNKFTNSVQHIYSLVCGIDIKKHLNTSVIHSNLQGIHRERLIYTCFSYNGVVCHKSSESNDPTQHKPLCHRRSHGEECINYAIIVHNCYLRCNRNG